MITAEQVKQLRDKTQASMMDCKKALEEAGGDFNKAAEILLKRGIQIASKRAEKKAGEGIVETYVHPNKKIGVLLELNCETDFVAKNEVFKELAHDLAMHIAAMDPKYISPEDMPEDIIEKEREKLLEQYKDSGKPEKVTAEIVEGKLKKFSDEICLTEQFFIKDQEKRIKDLMNEIVGKLGEKIKIGRFIRFQI